MGNDVIYCGYAFSRRVTYLRDGMNQRSTSVSMLTLGCLLAVAGFASGAEPVDFRRDVAPILERRCLSCHQDGEHRGGLSLQSAEMAGKGGESGKVIEPGDAASSYLLDVLIPTDGEAEMPKGKAPLAENEIDTIRRWIADGAKWPKGFVLKPPVLWSLRPITRPAVPHVETDEFLIRNPIDAYVAARHRDTKL